MLKFGIIGLGGMGCAHASSIETLGGRVTAGADPREQSRKAFAEAYPQAKTFERYEDMLGLKLDAVVVATPTYLHCEQITAAAKAGAHVFCEKPMCMTVAEADKILEATKKVKFMMAFCRRFDNHWGKVREVLLSGRVGRPVLWRHCAAGAGPGPNRQWFYDRKQGGGPLVDGAVHNYDFAHWTFGKPVSVYASMKRFKKDSTALDTGTAIIKFKSGDELMCCWSWGLPWNTSALSLIDILGPDGALFFDAPQDRLPQGFDPQKQGAIRSVREGKEEIHVFTKNNMYIDEMKHFIECVEQDKQLAADGLTGKVGAQIACAVIQSAETGKIVKIGPAKAPRKK